MGCDIFQHDNYSITLSHTKKLSYHGPQLLLLTLGRGVDAVATLDQATAYRHVIGKMLFIGHMSAPLIFLYASMAASKRADLRCHYLRALATTLTRLMREPAEFHFLNPDDPLEKPFLLYIISDGLWESQTKEKDAAAT